MWTNGQAWTLEMGTKSSCQEQQQQQQQQQEAQVVTSLSILRTCYRNYVATQVKNDKGEKRQ